MSKLLVFVAGGFVLGCGLLGLLRGRVMDGGKANAREIDREESPLSYWCTCLFYLGFGGFLLWSSLTG